MKKMLKLVACTAIMAGLWGCERPQSPDFKLDHKVQAPLMVEKTYEFLGNGSALIDTTSENFDSLFTVDSNGLIRLSKEEEFNFGDLNDAIPEVDVEPTTVNSQVGEINLSNFSSAGDVGSANFESITGFPAPLQNGDPVPASSTPGPINIDLSTDYFVSATIKTNGDLKLTLTNDLGFNFDTITLTLNSGGIQIGSTSFNQFNHDSTRTCFIPIPAGTQLSDLNMDVSADWSSQNMQEDAGSLIVNDVKGENLVASQVTAAVESQAFSSSGTSTVDDSKFKFTEADHFIELSGGRLSMNITNNIEIGIRELTISFPTIRKKTDDSPLSIKLVDIPSKLEGNSFSDSFPLSGYRIYAEDNQLNYNIDATTENTQEKHAIRTINENDLLQATVKLNNLEINKAKGLIIPRNILLNDDAYADEQLDVFNDQEAEVINIDGISELSEQISDVTFANPVLSTIYETNLSVKSTVYAVIVGINGNGEEVYLTGKEGGKYHVAQSEIPAELAAHGHTPEQNQLIKFKLEPSVDGSTISGLAKFDSTGTNASEFFSNLPAEIRFVGIARINEAKEEATISTPITFSPRLSVDLPLNFSAQSASFTDTLEADLSALPGEGDEQQLSEATFTINYTNGLPLGLDLRLTFMGDDQSQAKELLTYPLESQEPLKVQPATVDAKTGFVEEGGAKAGQLQISFNKDQLNVLPKTNSIILHITFNTTRQQEAKIRAEDSITLDMKMSADITSTYN